MESKKFRTPNHEIIDRFIAVNPSDKYFWPREMKLCKKLLAKYPLDFLKQLPPPFGTRVKSLAWFLTNDGKQYLNLHYFEYQKKTLDLSPKIQQVELLDTKIGEDVVIVKRPKTLKDFLKLKL